MPLSADLYKECCNTLLQCGEFDSYESLQAIFVTPELSIFQSRLPRARNREDLVNQTIAYLVPKRLDDQRPVFPIFLDALYGKRKPGDDLYDMLRRLANQTEQELNRNKAESTKIPCVIVAMTRDQANALDAGAALDHPTVAQAERARCEAFRKALREHGINIADLLDNYGEAREDWRPHTCRESTIGDIVLELVDRINDQRSGTDEPVIELEFSSSSFFAEDKVETWDRLGRKGCVIIVDAVSMFHPDLCHDLLHSELGSNEQVAMLVLSPVNPCTIPVNQHIEQGISSQMQRAFARFNTKLDELCEFNVGDLLTLRRWLLRVLPDVANAIEGQKMRPANRAMIDKRLGPPQGMQGLVIG